jgi:hypothetical protein
VNEVGRWSMDADDSPYGQYQVSDSASTSTAADTERGADLRLPAPALRMRMGNTYVPGSMTGLWVGRFAVSVAFSHPSLQVSC